jgi:hypothetical protein
MNLRSLIPSGNGASRTSPSANPFGSLHREIDRLFEDFTRGLDVGGPGPVYLVPSIDVSESDSGSQSRRKCRDSSGKTSRSQSRTMFDRPRREESRKRAGRQEQELSSQRT